MKYIAVASCHLNFYPGTLTPTPADYRAVIRSATMTRLEAQAAIVDWRAVMECPEEWRFEVREEGC